jgi:hypothetical protein
MWRTDLPTSAAAVASPPCLISVARPTGMSLDVHFHSTAHKTKRSLVTNGSDRELKLQKSNAIIIVEAVFTIRNIIRLSPKFNNVMPLLIKLIKLVHLSPGTMILLM